MCNVYTAGYEGRTINEFIDLMKANQIDCIVDVRELPISRKKGFSKTVLLNELQNVGIEYVHIKGLGSPKQIRYELYQSHDYPTFFNKYRHYVDHHFNYVQEAWEHVTNVKTCLLCFERDSRECHRSIVAELICTCMPNVDGVVNL